MGLDKSHRVPRKIHKGVRCQYHGGVTSASRRGAFFNEFKGVCQTCHGTASRPLSPSLQVVPWSEMYDREGNLCLWDA